MNVDELRRLAIFWTVMLALTLILYLVFGGH